MNPTDWALFKRQGLGDWYQRLLDYDGAGNLIYIGLAGRGVATSAPASGTSAPGWIVFKLAYDGSGNLTSVKTAPENSIWDDRSTLSYA